jgi:YfiR/HmsC-like
LKLLLNHIVLYCAVFLTATQPAGAQAVTPVAYQVKAVFLYNFCQFTDWPAESFVSPESPLVIAVLGPNPFGNYLEETIAGEKANGHPLVIRYFKEINDISNCHILFVNPAVKIKEVITAVNGRTILTVSDADVFAKAGGMIEFFMAGNKIRFKINVKAAKAAGLNISSKLLRLAEIVE